jgi:hypothetical protein
LNIPIQQLGRRFMRDKCKFLAADAAAGDGGVSEGCEGGDAGGVLGFEAWWELVICNESIGFLGRTAAAWAFSVSPHVGYFDGSAG